MKTIRLDSKDVHYLAKQPESGMGYQKVNIKLKDGRYLENRIVFNSEMLLLENNDEINLDNIEKVEIVTK